VGLGDAPPLFDLSDAAGNDLGPAGLQSGNVFGSFIHLIDHR
jgi:cobyrinic acid a,c-diamide synthase